MLRVAGGPFREWFRAIKGEGPEPGSNSTYSANAGLHCPSQGPQTRRRGRFPAVFHGVFCEPVKFNPDSLHLEFRLNTKMLQIIVTPQFVRQIKPSPRWEKSCNWLVVNLLNNIFFRRIAANFPRWSRFSQFENATKRIFFY
jgi:hypothetical protein